jgi:hypothetical protein
MSVRLRLRAHRRLVATAIVGSVIAVVAGGLAFAGIRAITRGDVAPATRPTVSSGPSRTSVHEAVLPGISGTVCNPSSVDADFGLGGAATDTAYVYGLPTAAGTCPPMDPRPAVIAIAPDTEQNSSSGVTITSDPIDCGYAGCRVFAAPDIDGDRIAELAVETQARRPSSPFLRLYTLTCPSPTACAAGDQAAIAQYAVRNKRSSDHSARVAWGAILGAAPASGATCATDANGGRLLRVWAARYIGSGALHDFYDLHEDTYSVRGTVLKFVKRTSEHAVHLSLAPSNRDFCGASVVN